ncbi:MAG: DedA family protein [Chloroflexi bacterium]|nr:MAG: DedA family protein [Chloroflexota bacterium]TMF14801.1 MAG: DedA family protein [Chloroflexota bacterium]
MNGGFTHLLATYGYLVVFLFIGIESLGVPFPGETMLITAAVYAGATHNLGIPGVILAAIAGAIIGDNIGFGIGWFGGYRLLRRYGRYIRLDEAKLKVGRYIFMLHGGKVVFFGRFVSVLRAYAAFLAGTNRMHWRRFLAYNAAGGIVWAASWGTVAYLLGSQINRLSTPVDIAFGVLGGIVLVAGILVIRAQEKRLEAAAEKALPGPLDDHMTRSR